MISIKQRIYQAMFWLLPWLCAMSMASCSFDNDLEQGDNGTATLQLSISAREEGDLNTRATGYEEGQNSEYMHNLLVLFVQNDQVVKKLLPDLTNDESAKTGNLKIWTSEGFTLTAGTYTVYAFANIDTYYNGLWGSLTGLGEGESIASLNVDDIVIEGNPAEKIDLSTYFIPMSAKQDVTVTPATRNISIGLDRLVSKIRMNITGKAGTEITSLSFGGYADMIPLFAGKTLNGEVYTTTKQIAIPGDGTLNAGTGSGSTAGTLVIPDFYVNSSPAAHQFTVNLEAVETTGITHNAQAVTSRNELPRNSIFPLTLQLNEYGLDLGAQCWVSPIGSLPVPVTVSFTPNTYEIDVPEGCQFAFTINGITVNNVSGGAGITDLKGTWSINQEIDGITFDGEKSGVTTVKGHVTASAGKTFSLKLSVTWKDGAATYDRTYYVTIHTKDLTDYPLYGTQTGNTTEFGINYLRHEMLNLFIK